MIDENDPFIQAVAASLPATLLAVCVNDERMGGDSARLVNGEIYELDRDPRLAPGLRACLVNSHGWQHSDHFAVITCVRCVNANGETGLDVGQTYSVLGGYFYGRRPGGATAWVVLAETSPTNEGTFALKRGGFAMSRFSIVEPGCSERRRK